MKLLISATLLLISVMPTLTMKLSPEEIKLKLITAAQQGNLNTLQQLLSSANLTQDQSILVNALVAAASYGKGNVCKYLVELKADVNKPDNVGQFALVKAAYTCDEQTCRLLLANRADANKSDHLGYTPLNQAAKRKDETVLNLLLDHVNTADQSQLASALIDAASYGNESICKRLVELKADVNRPNHIGQFALVQAAYACNEQTCKLLLANGADANRVCTSSGDTPLTQAAKRKDATIFNLLIPYVNTADPSQLTSALVAAAAWGNEAICKCLVELKADVNRPNYIGQYALIEAALRCSEQTCKLLLANGADANRVCISSGDTPLTQAAKRKDETLFNLLIPYVNTADQSQLASALVAATTYGNESICKRLFKLGADASLPNHIGQFALIEAARSRKAAMCKLLVDCQTANAKRRNTITLLMCLNRLKHEKNECARLLYRRRDVFILPYLTSHFFKPVKMLGMKDYMGKTPFDLLPREWLKPE